MILLYAILFILFEAICEGLLKRYYPEKTKLLFKWWVQDITAIGLFCIWFFVIALPFDGYYVPALKLITGFVFVRFLIFDVAYNLSNGQKWNHYGTTKLYDRIMASLEGLGWMAKAICGIVGICFLMGWQ